MASVLTAEVQLDNSQLLQAAAQTEKALAGQGIILDEFGQQLRKVGTNAQAVVPAMQQARTATQQFGQGSSGAASAIRGFSFILNDSQQFAFGFSQGLRAISNNVTPLLGSLQGMKGGFGAILQQLRGPLGLVLLIEAASTALVLFTQKSKEAKAEIDKLTNSTQQIVRSLFELTDVPERVAKTTLTALEGFNQQLKSQAQTTQNLLSSLRAQPRVGAVPGGLMEMAAERERLRILLQAGGSLEAARQLTAQRVTSLERELQITQTMQGEIEDTVTAARLRLQLEERIGGAFSLQEKGLRTRSNSLKEILRVTGQIARVPILPQIAPGAFDPLSGLVDMIRRLAVEGRNAEPVFNMIEALQKQMARLGGDRFRLRQGGAGGLESQLQLSGETQLALDVASQTVQNLASGLADVAVATFDFVTLSASLEDTFRSFGQAARQVMRRLVADFAAAIAKAIILRSLLNIAGGGFFGSVIRDVAGGFGFRAAQAAPTAALGGSVAIGGQLNARVRGSDLEFAVTLQQERRRR